MSSALIVGANGMLGYTLLRHLASSGFQTYGTVRRATLPNGYHPPPNVSLYTGLDVNDPQALFVLIQQLRPTVVLNCAGLNKQRAEIQNPLAAIAINALFPHKLAVCCSANASRLIHFSTDCVFSGNQGLYTESDHCDANDLYGRSKRLGEIDYEGHLTLRTSLIGHELASNLSLVDWFLSRTEPVLGYANAVFSGLPTIEVARLLTQFILPRSDLQGLLHLSAEPIDKDRLLRLIAHTYGHAIPITRTMLPKIDRSLDSSQLRTLIDYQPPRWETLIDNMHTDYLHAYAHLREYAEEKL